MSLPDYIAISVEAVGGTETVEGQEMLRLLLLREGGDAPAALESKPEATIAAPAQIADDENIMGEDFERMFSSALKSRPVQ